VQVQQFILPSAAPASLPPGAASAEADLVLVFGAVRHFDGGNLSGLLQAAFPRAVIAGCSTSGEIAGERTYDQSCVLTVVTFRASQALAATTPIAGMDDSFGAGARLAATLARAHLKSVLLFGPGVAINGSALLRGLQQGLPAAVSISGGLAGDDGAFRQTWTIGPAGCRDRHVVAVGLVGDRLHAGHGSVAGWQPFGPVRKVTRARGNVLFDLDGQCALDVYRRYLGSYADQLPSSGLLFPFEMLDAAHAQSGVLRTILGIDPANGSLTLAGDIAADGYLRLMHASTDQLVDAAELAARHAAGNLPAAQGASLALLVSCIGRKLVMGERVDEEVEVVAALLPQPVIAGFYSNGEIGPSGALGQCRLHNQTMSITLLTEH
jgi:hypothetical protein